MKGNSCKKIILLFTIGIVFVLASSFAIWGIAELSKGDGTLNFLGYIVCMLIGLVPTIGTVLVLLATCITLKTLFKDKEHPIRNSFIVKVISLFSVAGVIGLIPIMVNLVSFTAGSYLAWLIYDLAIVSILTIVYFISLVKFIIELVREYQKIRTAIIETRIIVARQTINRSNNQKTEH